MANPGRIGKYELLKIIAAGGMAEVYLARQTGVHQFEKIVAIKKILPRLATQSQFVQMFLDEARLVARFSHPNIAQVYDLGQENDELFIAMEYIHGEDLGSIVNRCSRLGSSLPIEHVVKICSEVLAGLHYAHSQSNLDGKQSVVHRDVSPHNIILSFDGVVKLVDFGVAKARSQLSADSPGKIKGKYAYMSPEQCQGDSLDGRSDIFSVGIVMYELITWTRLFKRENELGTLHAVVSGKIEPPSKLRPGLDRALDEIVLKSLDRDVQKRFQTAQEMQLQLEDYLVTRGLKTNPVILSQYIQNLFGDKLAFRKKALSEFHAESLEGALAASQQCDPELDTFLDHFFDDYSLGGVGQDGDHPEINMQGYVETGMSCGAEKDQTTGQGDRFDRLTTKKNVLRMNRSGPKTTRLSPRPKVPEDMALRKTEMPERPIEDTQCQENDPSTAIELLPRRKRINWFFVFSMLVIGVVAISLVLMFRGSALEPESPLYGRVVVSSDPVGADVFFDGSRLPARTPTEIEEVAPHVNHSLELSLPGFPIWKKSFVLVDTRQPLEFSVNLEQKRIPQEDLTGPPIIARAKGQGTGSLTIESRPKGALIFLDGLSTGLRTPQTLHEVAAEIDHVVLLEGKKGGLAFTRIALVENQQKKISLKLKNGKYKPKGRIKIRVESEPEGAMVVINSFPVKKTPVLVSLLASRSSIIDVELDGYHAGHEEVHPVPGVDLTLYFRLRKK